MATQAPKGAVRLDAEALIGYFPQPPHAFSDLSSREIIPFRGIVAGSRSPIHLIHFRQNFPDLGAYSLLIGQFINNNGDVQREILDIKANDPFDERVLADMIREFKLWAQTPVGHILLDYASFDETPKSSTLHKGKRALGCLSQMIDKLANTMLFGPDYKVIMRLLDELDQHKRKEAWMDHKPVGRIAVLMMWILEGSESRVEEFRRAIRADDQVHVTQRNLEEFTRTPTWQTISTLIQVLCDSRITVNNFVNSAGPQELKKQKDNGEDPSDAANMAGSGRFFFGTDWDNFARLNQTLRGIYLAASSSEGSYASRGESTISQVLPALEGCKEALANIGNAVYDPEFLKHVKDARKLVNQMVSDIKNDPLYIAAGLFDPTNDPSKEGMNLDTQIQAVVECQLQWKPALLVNTHLIGTEFKRYRRQTKDLIGSTAVDAIEWWHNQAENYPTLQAIAYDMLSIPASTSNDLIDLILYSTIKSFSYLVLSLV